MEENFGDLIGKDVGTVAERVIIEVSSSSGKSHWNTTKKKEDGYTFYTCAATRYLGRVQGLIPSINQPIIVDSSVEKQIEETYSSETVSKVKETIELLVKYSVENNQWVGLDCKNLNSLAVAAMFDFGFSRFSTHKNVVYIIPSENLAIKYSLKDAA
jgi:hypothetical protein